MAKKGRPIKLNDGVQEKLVQGIRLGATYEIACLYAGITYQTFQNWKKHAEDKTEGVFFDLFEAIARAEGEAAVKWLALIEKHATDNPSWAAWKLERRYPGSYGRTVQEHTGKDGGAIPILITGMSIDEL